MDLRDRGFIYRRLLSTDPAVTKDVALAGGLLIAEGTDQLEPRRSCVHCWAGRNCSSLRPRSRPPTR